MKIFDTIPNPLADVIYDELNPILTAIYSATDSIELEASRSGGVKCVDTGEREFRPSTDAECYQVEFSLFIQRATFDARKPLFGQVSEWLKQLETDIAEARANLERIECVRDVVVVPCKKARTA